MYKYTNYHQNNLKMLFNPLMNETDFVLEKHCLDPIKAPSQKRTPIICNQIIFFFLLLEMVIIVITLRPYTRFLSGAFYLLRKNTIIKKEL